MPHKFLLPAVVLVMIAGAHLTSPPVTTAQTAGTVGGPIPGDGGVALVVSGGGHINALVTSASSQGCTVRSAWTASDGVFASYIPGAPAIANQAFLDQFPGGSVPAGAPLVLHCQSSAPASGPPAAPPPPPPALLTFDQQVADAVFASINQGRQNAGLPPLVWNGALQTAAEQYAALVRDTAQVSHNLDADAATRAQRAGYPSTFAAEVIAMVGNSESLDLQRDAGVIFSTWMNSPQHRAIVLGGEYSDGAIGCASGTSGGLNAIYCVGLAAAP